MTTLPSLGFITSLARAAFSSRKASFGTVAPLPGDLAQLASWIAAGDLRVPKETFAFADASAAYERFLSGKAIGKVGLTIA